MMVSVHMLACILILVRACVCVCVCPGVWKLQELEIEGGVEGDVGLVMTVSDGSRSFSASCH